MTESWGQRRALYSDAGEAKIKQTETSTKCDAGAGIKLRDWKVIGGS